MKICIQCQTPKNNSLVFSLNWFPSFCRASGIENQRQMMNSSHSCCKCIINLASSSGLCIHWPGSKVRIQYTIDSGDKLGFPPSMPSDKRKTTMYQPKQLPKKSKISGFIEVQDNAIWLDYRVCMAAYTDSSSVLALGAYKHSCGVDYTYLFHTW